MVPVLASPGVLRVTRVLCSAVYVDNDFAGQAAFLWRRRDLRAVAPSVGIDLRPLLRHSLAALRSKRIYRRRLLGILLVACALVVTLVPLVVGGLVGRACRARTISSGAGGRPQTTWSVNRSWRRDPISFDRRSNLGAALSIRYPYDQAETRAMTATEHYQTFDYGATQSVRELAEDETFINDSSEITQERTFTSWNAMCWRSMASTPLAQAPCSCR